MKPDNMVVVEVSEILGERGCDPRNLERKRRRNGPGRRYSLQLLVRGKFIENDDSESDGEGEDDVDSVPDPNTFWIDKNDVLRAVKKPALRKLIEKWQKRVMSEL